MDDLDDKTGSEWLYIDSLKKNISDMQKDLKALRNDLDNLSDPVGSIASDVVSAISNVQDILKDLNDYGLISDDRYKSINGTLEMCIRDSLIIAFVILMYYTISRKKILHNIYF